MPGASTHLLLEIAGWRERSFTDRPMDFSEVRRIQEKMLNRLENTGYPFAKIYLDSIHLDKEKISALLKVEKGPLYTIDSIRIYGNARISNYYLQRYLDITNGSPYNREKLLSVNKKMRELTYIEEEKPFDLSMLATGSVLNMYLKQKRSSQVNVLIGFLPNNDQLSSKKLLLTGEANILFKEFIGFRGSHWVELATGTGKITTAQPSFQHPYLFNSPFGLDFALDILRKDSSFSMSICK